MHDNPDESSDEKPLQIGADYRASPGTISSSYRAPIGVEKPAEILPPIATEAARTGAVDPDDIRGAFSAATRRAYASDWRTWSRWCEGRCAPLPAAAVDVAAYLKERAAGGTAFSSLKRSLAAIATAHRVAGQPFDAQSDALHFALRRLAKELGVAARNARAELMTADILAILPKGEDLLSARNRCILLLGFAGGFRRSELVALDIADLAFRRDGLTITIRRSKTDQAGAGQLVGILYGAKERSCPVRALKAWLARAAIAEGAVFREINGRRLGADRLSGQAVWRIVKREAARAGIDPARLGAHSLRVGHVTQALENGADPVKVQAQARHKRLDTTLGYNRTGAALKDSSSGKLGL